MDRKTIARIAILLIIGIGLVVGLWYLQSPKKQYTGQPESINIGTSPFEVSGLIFIAQDQGFFANNGLNATIKMYDAGIIAMDALYAGDLDVATAAELVFVRNVLNDKKIHGIASIGKSDFHYIIARKDKGIFNISDLKGKKIGVARGTSADFYLGRFLELHGIKLQDVTIVNLKPADMVAPLINGEVDAVSTWDPYAYPVENRLGVNATVWADQSGQLMYWMAICRDDLITNRPELIDRFLQALNQAEDFAVNHPDEARKIVQKRLGSDDAYMERIWSDTQLMLSLDQSLIIAMDDETRWLIKNNLTDKKEVPVFLDYIYRDGLNAVQPEAVNIIR
jgi:NitT/TauT family transport system substrate-binding protein